MKSANISITQQNIAYKSIVKISLVLLITLLFSFVSHAQHHNLVIDVNETQQCQLCQHNIDTPPEFVVFSAIAQTHLPLSDVLVVDRYFTKGSYTTPPLRAPPVQK
jgi:hypothetical protein